MKEKGKIRVAVVGSGMAGLVTAYLLQRDERSRYAVTIFEENTTLSLDSASLTVPNGFAEKPDRIDLPMRAFAGGYYQALRAMYDHLGVSYHAQPFIFDFSRVINQRPYLGPKFQTASSYFVHSSNNHRVPPIRPRGIGTITWLVEILYLLACYGWFTVCCFSIRPREDNADGLCERLDEYLQRIRLPRYFTTYYLVPLLCSVATCSHEDLLSFPAIDVTEYKRKSSGQQHYTVSNGIQSVQNKLAGAIDVRLSTRVSVVETKTSGVRIRWKEADDAFGVTETEGCFDRVVLAIEPHAVGRIFDPPRAKMTQMPVVTVESIIHSDTSTVGEREDQLREKCGSSPAQTIHLRTLAGETYLTESIHVQPSGALVTTCPFTPIDQAQIIKSSRFPRVLRTADSRSIVNAIFDQKTRQAFSRDVKSGTKWRNGDGNVWLVGGWCWDGMVLLEGCVISAMRVAEAFDVQIPW